MFTAFTISQTGLVRHWHSQRLPRWLLRAALNGTGAVLTATATVVFVATKFTSGAWVVILIVQALMLLFSRIQSYYKAVRLELRPRQAPAPPHTASSLVIMPLSAISELTERRPAGGTVPRRDEVILAVTVHPGAGARHHLPTPTRTTSTPASAWTSSTARPSSCARSSAASSARSSPSQQVAVLIADFQPRHWRYQDPAGGAADCSWPPSCAPAPDAVLSAVPYRLTSR